MKFTVYSFVSALSLTALADGFTILTPKSTRPSLTTVYLEDRIARMIDREYYREQHLSEFESEWMKQNREAVLHGLRDTADPYMATHIDSPDQEFRERARDRMLAIKEPERYCADRCMSTGNCDIYEDLYVESMGIGRGPCPWRLARSTSMVALLT
jgi:hypothetical protein